MPIDKSFKDANELFEFADTLIGYSQSISFIEDTILLLSNPNAIRNFPDRLISLSELVKDTDYQCSKVVEINRKYGHDKEHENKAVFNLPRVITEFENLTDLAKQQGFEIRENGLYLSNERTQQPQL